MLDALEFFLEAGEVDGDVAALLVNDLKDLALLQVPVGVFLALANVHHALQLSLHALDLRVDIGLALLPQQIDILAVHAATCGLIAALSVLQVSDLRRHLVHDELCEVVLLHLAALQVLELAGALVDV